MGWIIVNVVTSEIFGQNFRNLKLGQKLVGDLCFITDQDKKEGWYNTPKVFQLLRDAHAAFHVYFRQRHRKLDLLTYQFVLVDKNKKPITSVDIREHFTYYERKL